MTSKDKAREPKRKPNTSVKKAGAVAKAEPTDSELKEARGTAKLAIHPSANAALVIAEFSKHFGDLDVGDAGSSAKGRLERHKRE